MNEQSCGTCDYFTQKLNDESGTCWWATKNMVPVALSQLTYFTYRTWGEDCPCWIEKKF